MQYYLFYEGRQMGPFTEEQLRSMVLSGAISSIEPAWYEGLETWTPLSSLINIPSKATVPLPPLPPSSNPTLRSSNGSVKKGMIRCSTCGHPISRQAGSCPSCGAKKQPSGIAGAGCIILVIFLVVVFAIVSGPSSSTPPSSPIPHSESPKTPLSVPTAAAVLPPAAPKPQPEPTQESLNSFVRLPNDHYGELKTKDGRVFVNATVTKVDPSDVVIQSDAGMAVVPLASFGDVPPDLKKIYEYDATLDGAYKKAQGDLASKQKEEADEIARRKEEVEKGQRNLNAFISIMNASGVPVIKSASVERHMLTISVRDEWHLQAKQIRFEETQNLWKVWASIDSPGTPDVARISITDENGNEVGGSRIWAGSLIWVQD